MSSESEIGEMDGNDKSTPKCNTEDTVVPYALIDANRSPLRYHYLENPEDVLKDSWEFPTIRIFLFYKFFCENKRKNHVKKLSPTSRK